MNTKTKTIAVFAAMAMVVSSCAQQKKGMVKGDSEQKVTPPVLVAAIKQTTLPGRQETPPHTSYRHIIVWKNKTSPTTFFWRGETGWMPCKVSSVKGYNKDFLLNEKNVFQLGYETQEISLDKIKMNDTLELYPTTGGKHPIPEVVTTTVKNTIFYNAENKKWLTLPVANFIERPDIIMQ